jgi:hypothetical protein
MQLTWQGRHTQKRAKGPACVHTLKVQLVPLQVRVLWAQAAVGHSSLLCSNAARTPQLWEIQVVLHCDVATPGPGVDVVLGHHQAPGAAVPLWVLVQGEADGPAWQMHCTSTK